jgi:nucleoside-diphosphate-sugar epimerase
VRILVVGARGFVGVDLTFELLRRGHEVVAFEARGDLGRLAPLAKDIEWRIGDCADLESILAAIGPRGIDAIYYGPFYRSPTEARNLATELRVMGTGALSVFNLARVMDIRRILFPSSIAVHGVQKPSDGTLDEDSAVRPFGLYGAIKLMGEKLGIELNQDIGRNVVTAVRLPAVWGPAAAIAARRVNVFPVKAARGLRGDVEYTADTRICVGDVRDTAAFLANVLEAETARHTVYELGGTDVTFADIAAATLKVVPDAECQFGDGTVCPLPHGISTARARAEFRLEHRDIAATVADTIAYERNATARGRG